MICEKKGIDSNATLLSGREYLSEITSEEEEQAKAAGLVVVFGFSDDCMEFRGAINAEVSCYGGGTAYFSKSGLINPPLCGGEDCPYFAAAKKDAAPIKAVWHDNDPGPCWTYEMEIPHESFEIIDEGEHWCIGIVFNMKDLCARQGAEKPLALEELRGMVQRCEGIYVAKTDGTPLFREKKYCAAVLDIVPAFGSSEMHIQAIYGRNLTLWDDDYKKTWVAFRCPPVKEEN